MITMDVKGINWVGNIYQKFETMCLEAEDVICEDAVKYIENQMQTVGESVKKLYSEVIGDIIPPSSCGLNEKVASELPVDQYTDAGYSEKPFLDFKEKPVREDTKQTNNDSRVDHGANINAIHAASDDGTPRTDALFMSSSRRSVKESNFISHSRHYAGNEDIKNNLGIDRNKVNKRLSATKILDEITLAETDACRMSQSCELSSTNQNQIENASTEQYSNIPAFIESGFSTDETIQSDDCSYSMVVLSHSESNKTRQQDHLKLEETCVMVTGDELKLIPKESINVKTNKKKRRKGFSLSKKSARKQEYEELAVWHGQSEKVKVDCEDQKKLVPPCMSESEWELI